MKFLCICIITFYVVSSNVAVAMFLRVPQNSTDSAMKTIFKNTTSQPLDLKMLKDLMNLLNAGKKSIGLRTERPEEFLAMVTKAYDLQNSTSVERLEPSGDARNKSSMEVMMEESSNLKDQPDEEIVLDLSGEEENLHVNNAEDVPLPESDAIKKKENETEVQDVFEMVLEKDVPSADGRSGKIERIEIVEHEVWQPLVLYSTSEAFIPLSESAIKRSRQRRDVPPGDPTSTPKTQMTTVQNEWTASSFGLTLPLFGSAMSLMLILLVIGLLYVKRLERQESSQRESASVLRIGFLRDDPKMTKRSLPCKEEDSSKQHGRSIGSDNNKGFVEVDLQWPE